MKNRVASHILILFSISYCSQHLTLKAVSIEFRNTGCMAQNETLHCEDIFSFNRPADFHGWKAWDL